MDKEYSTIDHQHPPPAEEKSNLTCASGEATAYSTVSSSNKNDTNSGILYPAPNQQPQPTVPLKKKRNQPGHPDPGSEVIALSPKTLMATNRFVCEICNKGFQREQNLQLHRRGHNLPWKLKLRTTKEARRKVYVCPETNCVHHDPTRALGDLTGIKKHFSRKHGEKKWKCDKCSKRYAVQSDWKAHSKTCGTKDYRCDCGTLFTRRDSFITHRAFCDALVQETERSITANNTIINPLQQTHHPNFQQSVHQPQFNNNGFPLINYPVKKEQQSINDHIPPWLPSPPIIGPGPDPPSPSLAFQHFQQNHDDNDDDDDHNNPNPNPNYTSYHPHFSATALLQKASQMGVKSSCTPAGPHQATSGLNFMASRDQFISSLACYNGNNNKAAALSVAGGGGGGSGNNSLFYDMMMMTSTPHGFDGSTFDDKEDGNGMTRDFLGLRRWKWDDKGFLGIKAFVSK